MISLSLRSLARGEAPDLVCPGCGAEAVYYTTGEHTGAFRCGSRHASDRLGVVRSGHPCPSPRPSAVLRAVLARLTPEQRERVILHEGRGVGDVRLTAGDALELLIEESPRA